ncbi:hypothetical protein ACIQPR_42405 [Streptomyces sp. NPDC091280]|uniref:hypothetical protein n=1 Tax=Streptomyces sp. NPDC091280 TaxID=3365984 RepID=UPI0037F13F1C
MLTRLLAATGVLGLLPVVPGPDMALVTRRALVAGHREALRTTSIALIGLGLVVATASG